MQSLFRLSWYTDSSGTKNKRQSFSAHSCNNNNSTDNKLKRKRTDSLICDEVDNEARKTKYAKLCNSFLPKSISVPIREDLYIEKYQTAPEDICIQKHESALEDLPIDKHETAPEDFVIPKVESKETTQTKDTLMDTNSLQVTSAADSDIQAVNTDLEPLRDIIAHQFNLEILTKHRELRLIDQELAKCQIALEQLRRCEIIPFPGTEEFLSEMTNGIGASFNSGSLSTKSTSASPWGVTDGPYTRHYANWLLPDPSFDSMTNYQTPVTAEPWSTISDGRTTRLGGVTPHKIVKARQGRGHSISNTLSSYVPPIVRSKSGPLVIKRMEDDSLVKLICTKCQRGDFSSVQGFLNHCRIAHKIDYKSHEAAAKDCGQLLEDYESNLKVHTSSSPVVTRTTNVLPKIKTTNSANQSNVTKVHPLNQEIIYRPTWKHQRATYLDQRRQSTTVELSSNSTLEAVKPCPSFIPSSSMPHLSNHLSKNGASFNLAAIMAKLGEKIDLNDDEEEEDGDVQEDEDLFPPIKDKGKIQLINVERPQSRKGMHSRPRPQPLNSSFNSSNGFISPPSHDLSPHTDSNPGMISDHDDDPHSDVEEIIRSDMMSSNSVHIHDDCHDVMDLDMHYQHENMLKGTSIN